MEKDTKDILYDITIQALGRTTIVLKDLVRSYTGDRTMTAEESCQAWDNAIALVESWEKEQQ